MAEASHKLVSEIECLDHGFRHDVAMARVREHFRSFKPGTIEQQINACSVCGHWQDDPRKSAFDWIEDDEVYCACCLRIFKRADSPMDSMIDSYSESFFAGIATHAQED